MPGTGLGTAVADINESGFAGIEIHLGGRDQGVSVANLKDASDFYNNRLTSLKLKEIERQKTLLNLSKDKIDLENQRRNLSGKKEFSMSEILVKIDAKRNGTAKFELSYVVGNAGWLPSYDIRAKNINEPIELIYKANVRQDTKIEWKNVKLKFSSANPNVSGVAPELKTYYLN